eukprot:200700_1
MDILVDTPIDKKELKNRTLQIISKEQNISKIISDTMIQENKIQINDKLNFTIDSKYILQLIANVGIISETTIPILEKLEYDGLIKVFWKLNKMNEDEKDNENKNKEAADLSKICIEYCMIDNNENKDNDIDEKQAKSKEFNVNNEMHGNESIIIDTVGTYLFKLRCYENNIWSPYSNVKSISVNEIIIPELVWDQTQHGKDVQFIQNNRVK